MVQEFTGKVPFDPRQLNKKKKHKSSSNLICVSDGGNVRSCAYVATITAKTLNLQQNTNS